MNKGVVITIGGGAALGLAFMVASQISKHDNKPSNPQNQVQEQKAAPASEPFRTGGAGPLPVEAEPAAPEGPTQDELNETLVRGIYDMRTRAAAACKVPGISDAGLSTTLAIRLFSTESPRMERELQAQDLSPLSQENLSLETITVGDKDLWTFLQENKVIPVVEYTSDPTLGAAFFNGGGQKTLVLYASQTKDSDGNVGTSYNISNEQVSLLQDMLNPEKPSKPGVSLVFLDDSKIGEGEWTVHTFRQGDKPFQLLEGVRQTLVPPPHNPCAPAASPNAP